MSEIDFWWEGIRYIYFNMTIAINFSELYYMFIDDCLSNFMDQESENDASLLQNNHNIKLEKNLHIWESPL